MADLSVFPSRRHQTGFTLIELLIAVSILAIVAVLGWRGLDSITRARTALNQDLDQSRGMQLSFAQLQSDCEHVALNMDLGGRAILAIDPQRLTLVRTVLADSSAASLQVVAYRVKDGVLQRRESNAVRDLRQLDVIWKATLGDTDGAQTVNLQQGITSMVVQTWFGDNTWSVTNGEIMGPQAATAISGPTPPSKLPSGLQVALQVQGLDGSMVKNFLLGAI